ncbi:bacillithiol system redox-active protein YtxJ [uncultured Roseivirga sp.]|uniref:bacillithiol system redox-active protein YtxJ n=2 Tax=Roseivirga TaxID=290180 RepID=UPI0032B2E55A|tara:strand:+ start:536 stop:907 length:372 start_codon:yes stop_codon:yes gene_type:complete
MFWKKDKRRESSGMQWTPLTTMSQLETIVEESHKHPVLIYKHSTRCGISSMALGRLEREWSHNHSSIKSYYLDLIAHRNISNQVSASFGVAHESPQVILIKKGKPVYHASHLSISANDLISHQ